MTTGSAGAIYCQRGGESGPLLVLLHGLGATGAVWEGLLPLLEAHWPGRWLIPDFRGHGRSSHQVPYGIGIHAADVASLLHQGEEVCVIGHSMGGVVGMALATGLFGLRVRSVVAHSVKVDWSEEDASRGQALARAPAKLFATRAEAIERYLRVAGLAGMVAADSASAASGVAESGGQFRLAADPRCYDLGTPDFARLAGAVAAPLHLFCGERDNIASLAGMERLGRPVTLLAGLGHNPQVEAPAALWAAIAPALQ